MPNEKPNPVNESGQGANRRGRGKGRRAGRGGEGATKCICPKCGKEEPHERGTPCTEKTCPNCGTRMIGKR